jgi:integrase
MARPKKIQYIKLKPHKNAAGSQSWRVTGTLPDGTRIRQNFREKSDALQRMADLELEIEEKPESRRALRTLLSPEELSDAESAIRQINGGSISKVVAHYLNLQARVREKGTDLDQAIFFFEARYRPETKEISILNAKDEFLRSRAGISTTTRRNYDSGLSLLLKPDPNRSVHAFSVGDIEESISDYKNLSSRKTHRRIFSIFFNWAVRHHYCLENPCKRLDKLPKDMTQIAALSLDESKRLLYAAVCLQDGAAASAIAIGLFAGLRPSEIKDLKAEDIGEKRIRVTGGKLRRKLKRTAPIPPVLAAWLKKHPFTGLPGGWGYKMKALKKATKAKKWVQDIIRHTSITFQTERDQNEALTAYNNGTSIQMMNQHYRHTIDDDKTVDAFWGLTPAKLMAKKPEIVLPGRPRIAWPDKKALAKLVWQKPLIHAAADIGVSDVALRKHCVKLAIDLPAPGHWLRQRRDEKR